MARKVDKLTDITIQKAIKKAAKPKLYDGGGLFLQWIRDRGSTAIRPTAASA